MTREHPHLRDDFQLGSTKIFLRENLEQILEKRRYKFSIKKKFKKMIEVRVKLMRRDSIESLVKEYSSTTG